MIEKFGYQDSKPNISDSEAQKIQEELLIKIKMQKDLNQRIEELESQEIHDDNGISNEQELNYLKRDLSSVNEKINLLLGLSKK